MGGLGRVSLTSASTDAAVTAGPPATPGLADEDYGRLLEEFRSGQHLLREAEARFKLLVETIPGVAYIAEPGEYGAWLYISPRLQDLLGFAAEDWIADPTITASTGGFGLRLGGKPQDISECEIQT
jgi:PAS domain-containing protein